MLALKSYLFLSCREKVRTFYTIRICAVVFSERLRTFCFLKRSRLKNVKIMSYSFSMQKTKKCLCIKRLKGMCSACTGNKCKVIKFLLTLFWGQICIACSLSTSKLLFVIFYYMQCYLVFCSHESQKALR